MKKTVFLLLFLILGSSVFAECKAEQENTAEGVDELFAAAAEIEERIDNRSFWKKMFIGGDLENGKELKAVVDEIKSRFADCCKCDTEEQRKLLKHYETKAVIEINRRGLFGWFRGFY